MRLASNWVTEGSSQNPIHLMKFTNIQPRNNIIKKKQQKNQKYIYTNTNNQSTNNQFGEVDVIATKQTFLSKTRG